METPTVWIEGLRSQSIWDCGSWPFVRALEAEAPRIVDEVLRVTSRFAGAYPYLSQQGTWENLFLYRNGAWNASLCEALPLTCRALVPELPTKPALPLAVSSSEEVVIFRTRPGASVGPHAGASNSQINAHLTLTGGEGTFLRTGGRSLPLADGKAICFQDSFVHAVEHREDGAAERITLVVRLLHPEMTSEVYAAGAGARSAEPSEALAREVERLRSEYRKLAQACGGSGPRGEGEACRAGS